MKRSRERTRRRAPDGSLFRFDSPPRDAQGNLISSTSGGKQPFPFNIWQVRPEPIVTNFSKLKNVIAADSSLSLAVDCQMAMSELYVGNLPPGITPEQLKQFINRCAAVLGIGPQAGLVTASNYEDTSDESGESEGEDGQPAKQFAFGFSSSNGRSSKQTKTPTGVVASVAMASKDRNFAWVTFRKDRYALLSLQMSGIYLCGKKLRFGRTYAQIRNEAEDRGLLVEELKAIQVDQANVTVGAMQQQNAQQAALAQQQLQQQPYNAAAMLPSGSTQMNLGILQDQKYCLHNIPSSVEEEKISQLLRTFGPLKYFQVVKLDGQSIKAAFFEFSDYFTQKNAPVTLQGLTMAGNKLQIITPEEAFQVGFGRGKVSIGDRVIPSKILYIGSFISEQELCNDEEYDEICADIRDECATYGRVIDMVVPRPHDDTITDADRLRGVGYGFIEFADVVSSSKAKRDFDGRKFGDFTMEANFFNVKLWQDRDFKSVKPNTEAEPVIHANEEEMDISSSG
ncbi:unnamed protein product [Amoebophrya sp. A120]|nr:unnamed protein product [Amoebophrya sp. A120]|eukprot:GSA120T00011459001.1